MPYNTQIHLRSLQATIGTRPYQYFVLVQICYWAFQHESALATLLNIYPVVDREQSSSEHLLTKLTTASLRSNS